MKPFHFLSITATIAATIVSLPSYADSVDLHVNIGDVSVGIDIGSPPPTPIVETRPEHRAGHIWAPGYWAWDGHRHVWVNGSWEKERPGYAHVPGHWEQRGNRWHFEPARWEEHKAIERRVEERRNGDRRPDESRREDRRDHEYSRERNQRHDDDRQ